MREILLRGGAAGEREGHMSATSGVSDDGGDAGLRAHADATVFRLTAEGVDLEFAGTEAFVEKQVLRFRSFLERAVGVAPTESAPAEPTRERVAFGDFASARPIREGRGAIQDRLLLAIFYLSEVQGKREVSSDDLMWCFQDAGWERPKNLHNALGILKRKLEHLQEGSRRGLYQLSAKGKRYAEGRFGEAN